MFYKINMITKKKNLQITPIESPNTRLMRHLHGYTKSQPSDQKLIKNTKHP